jgi:hypothetical protein
MDIIPELLRGASNGRQIVLALDSDQAGQQAARQLAEVLVSRGLQPDRLRLFTWPAKDANETLLAGWQEKAVLQAIKSSPAWPQVLIVTAADAEGEELVQGAGLQTLFATLARLNDFELQHYRQLACERLKIRKGVFDRLLQTARRASTADQSPTCRYLVHEGCLSQRFYDAAGKPFLKPLCNFNAWIEQDVLHDNGQDILRMLRVAGLLNHKPLPQVMIRANQFAHLDWVLQEWGSAAIIEPGNHSREHLRAAIQYLSQGVLQRRIYTHTGWMVRDGGRVFLSAGGAIAATSFSSSWTGFEASQDTVHMANLALGIAGQGGSRIINADGHGVVTGEHPDQDSQDCAQAGIGALPNAGDLEQVSHSRVGGKNGSQLQSTAGKPEKDLRGTVNAEHELLHSKQQLLDRDDIDPLGDMIQTGKRQLSPILVGQDDQISDQKAEPIEVELDRDLALYNLPTCPTRVASAMVASLSYLDLAPPQVTFPLWSAMWLAPLRGLVSCAFSLWVYGATGTFKSTLAALALNHYGPGFDDKHLPASFTDTVNRLEHKAFVVKDAPLVIDDFAPQKETRTQNEYIRTAHRIVRGAGNLSGRGRLNSASIPLATYVPRSLLIITGEDLPNSQSLVARLFVVEINQGDLLREKLSVLQSQRDLLSHAMAAYLSWLAANWDGLKETLPARWQHYREGAIQAGLHMRLPEALASLSIGLEMGLRFAVYLGQLDGASFQYLLQQGRAAFAEGNRKMLARLQEEKPEEMYLRTLWELLAQGKVYLQPLAEGAPLGDWSGKSEMIGWHDDQYLYLLPQAAFNRIARHYRDQGDSFPVGETTLRKLLKEAGLLVYDAKRRTRSVWVKGKAERVLVLKRKSVGL